MSCIVLNPRRPGEWLPGSVSQYADMALLVADAAIEPPHSRSCHAKFKLDTKV